MAELSRSPSEYDGLWMSVPSKPPYTYLLSNALSMEIVAIRITYAPGHATSPDLHGIAIVAVPKRGVSLKSMMIPSTDTLLTLSGTSVL